MKTKREKEQRLFFNIDHHMEQREDGNTDMILEGYATVFNQRVQIGDDEWGFFEQIDRNAFDGADLSDVPMKYNHNDAVPILARTRNGSLSLSVDDTGLKIRAKLLDTQDARDMYKRVQEGLIDKMSFAFTISKQEWDNSTKPVPTRTIKQFDRIWDVSVVDIPAYDGTSVYARSLELAEADLKELESKKHERNHKLAGLLIESKN